MVGLASAWIGVVGYPLLTHFGGLEFDQPLYELPILLLWFAAMLQIYADFRRGKSDV
jgi:hypothetical protein